MSQSNGDQEAKGKVERGILEASNAFRGLTYGDHLAEWVKWLVSESPTYEGSPNEVLYLHGNVSYLHDRTTGARLQTVPFENNTSVNGVFCGSVIYSNTPIFIPILSSSYSVGERYYDDGRLIQTMNDCKFICRRDIYNSGPFWCTLEKADWDKPLDLSKWVHYYESPSFTLNVSEYSPLKDRFETPWQAGQYEAFAAALAIMLNTSLENKNWLEEGRYRLRFGGYGRNNYSTDAVQDLVVEATAGGMVDGTKSDQRYVKNTSAPTLPNTLPRLPSPSPPAKITK